MAIISRIPRGNYALYKLVAAIPSQSGTLAYTGSAVSPTWANYDPDQLTIGGTYSATDAGTYTATFTPKQGYRWWDKSTGAKTATWSIGKATLTVPSASGSYTYNGSTQYIVFMGLDTSTMATSGTLSAVNAGTYSAKVSIINPANFQWSDGTTAEKGYSWSIAKIVLTAPTSSGTYTYNKTQQTLAFSGYSSSTMTKGGTYAATNAGSYTATIALKDTTNYKWNDGTTAAKSYPWSIATATVTAPTFSGSGGTYDGTQKTITVTGFDSATMTKSGTFSATNAGSYTATVSLTDSANYKWNDGTTAAKSYAWSIAKLSIAAPTASGSYTYDGAEKSIVFTGFNSNTMTKGGTYSATNAGNYSATVALKDATNYQWSDGTSAEKGYGWSIAKANPAVPTLSKYSQAFTAEGSTTFTVTRSGDGGIHTYVSDTTVATASVNGTTVTVTAKKPGTCVVTVYVYAGTNYNAYTGTGAQFTATGTVELTNCITFSRSGDFSLSTMNLSKNWDGTLQYTDGTKFWQTWNGASISSSGGHLYLRGIGNTVITGQTSGTKRKWWVLTQSNISCTGNVETLLDYATVANGGHPTMGNYCFDSLFSACEALVSAPVLGATTLSSYCYRSMFNSCTSLIEPPALPATTLATYCYNTMFAACTSLTKVAKLDATGEIPSTAYNSMYFNSPNIKISQTYSSEYPYAFRIPTTGTASGGSATNMFYGTGGTFTGTPNLNTTYYTTEEPV